MAYVSTMVARTNRWRLGTRRTLLACVWSLKLDGDFSRELQFGDRRPRALGYRCTARDCRRVVRRVDAVGMAAPLRHDVTVGVGLHTSRRDHLAFWPGYSRAVRHRDLALLIWSATMLLASIKEPRGDD